MISTILFTWGDFARIGILINIGIWLRLRYLRLKYEKENVFVNVYRDQKLRNRATISQFSNIWVSLFVIVCIAVFPTVYVASADTDKIPQCTLAEQQYSTKKYYVPFYYNGVYHKPFKRYISNDTDSVLALYEYKIWFGEMQGAGFDNIKALIFPHSSIEFTEDMRFTDSFVLPDTAEYRTDIKKIGMLDFIGRAASNIRAIQSYNLEKYAVEEPDSTMVLEIDSTIQYEYSRKNTIQPIPYDWGVRRKSHLFGIAQ